MIQDIFDYDIEYKTGVRYAENDISRCGLKYARNLLQGQDKEDPYIKGYIAYYFDYIDQYGEWE